MKVVQSVAMLDSKIRRTFGAVWRNLETTLKYYDEISTEIWQATYTERAKKYSPEELFYLFINRQLYKILHTSYPWVASL